MQRKIPLQDKVASKTVVNRQFKLDNIIGCALIVLFVLFTPFLHSAPSLPLKFAYGENEDPPIYYLADTGELMGEAIEILTKALLSKNAELTAVIAPRKRLEFLFVNQLADIGLANPEWVSPFLPVVFSKPIYQYSEFFYYDKNVITPPIDLNSVIGRRICTHRGYTYKKINHFFEQNQAFRIDAKTEIHMIRMLAANRCNLLVGPSYLIDPMLHQLDVENRLLRSNSVVENWNVRFMLHESLSSLLPLINSYIDEKSTSTSRQKRNNADLYFY